MLIAKPPQNLTLMSNYARLFLRHYNKLDHEFDVRNVTFFAGSVLAVLMVLTVIDENVLAVEYVLTTMTVAG